VRRTVLEVASRSSSRSRTWWPSGAADVSTVYVDSGAFLHLLVEEDGTDLAAGTVLGH
jgi:hypothetical protein